MFFPRRKAHGPKDDGSRHDGLKDVDFSGNESPNDVMGTSAPESVPESSRAGSLAGACRDHGRSEFDVVIDEARSWDLSGRIPIDDHTIELELESIAPRSLAVALPKLKCKTTGFVFPEAHSSMPAATAQDPDRSTAVAAKRKRLHRHSTSKRVRIAPPKDVVKLQDRLYYLLQPPLDLLVGSGQLNFPFEPFPYQLDGIAFMFPRYSCILADEMGLGKTMQAISTIRLLLCSGEIRSVL
ncbi:MAG: SNF2-related protein, partial [Planctomycetota bacterium]